jgi:hypothetical protein
VIPALRRVRQEDHNFVAKLGYIVEKERGMEGGRDGDGEGEGR